jgi:mono/diheme cytochrome c family protein
MVTLSQGDTMNLNLTIAAGMIAMFLALPAFAAPNTDSAARGKALHTQQFSGGKADTPSCTSCHGADPRAPGRSQTGKLIEPMAVSASPLRYTNSAKVEKWFKRNCTEVLGRECTTQEKGDWLAYMTGQ